MNFLINSTSASTHFKSCLCHRFFKLWVACRPSYKLAKLLRMTFLEPDLFRMLCFKTVLCHEMVYQPFRSPLCFLEFSNLMSVFNKISSLSSLFWSISSCSSVGSNDLCSLSDLLSLYLAKDTFGIVTNPTTAVGKIVFYLPFQ